MKILAICGFKNLGRNQRSICTPCFELTQHLRERAELRARVSATVVPTFRNFVKGDFCLFDHCFFLNLPSNLYLNERVVHYHLRDLNFYRGAHFPFGSR